MAKPTLSNTLTQSSNSDEESHQLQKFTREMPPPSYKLKPLSDKSANHLMAMPRIKPMRKMKIQIDPNCSAIEELANESSVKNVKKETQIPMQQRPGTSIAGPSPVKKKVVNTPQNEMKPLVKGLGQQQRQTQQFFKKREDQQKLAPIQSSEMLTEQVQYQHKPKTPKPHVSPFVSSLK